MKLLQDKLREPISDANHRYDNVRDKNEESRNEQQVPTDTTKSVDKNEERRNEQQVPTDTTMSGDKNEERWNEHQGVFSEEQSPTEKGKVHNVSPIFLSKTPTIPNTNR